MKERRVRSPAPENSTFYGGLPPISATAHLPNTPRCTPNQWRMDRNRALHPQVFPTTASQIPGSATSRRAVAERRIFPCSGDVSQLKG
jgi:hypothetical protein